MYMEYDIAIIGGGPAGYTAAERASENGLKTILFEKNAIGGVCLNEGCIPTKTLLYYNYLNTKIRSSNGANCFSPGSWVEVPNGISAISFQFGLIPFREERYRWRLPKRGMYPDKNSFILRQDTRQYQRSASKYGIVAMKDPSFDLAKIIDRKNKTVRKLTLGVKARLTGNGVTSDNPLIGGITVSEPVHTNTFFTKYSFPSQ